jgi:hypothetical protein
MNNFLSALILLTFSLLLSKCSVGGKKGHLLKYESKEPDFVDGGKTSDSLTKTWGCQVIEYENWQPNDLNDSILTVSLINCKTPLDPDPGEQVFEFKDIAKHLKDVLRKPEKYNLYYIIFVKIDSADSRQHRDGAEIRSSDIE